MPCYTVQTLSVEFQIKHKDLIEAAAKSLGLSVYVAKDYVIIDNLVTINFKTGEATDKSSNSAKAQEMVNLLKKQYSIEAIGRAASKAGWSKEQLSRLNARRAVNKITVSRR